MLLDLCESLERQCLSNRNLFTLSTHQTKAVQRSQFECEGILCSLKSKVNSLIGIFDGQSKSFAQTQKLSNTLGIFFSPLAFWKKLVSERDKLVTID